MLIGIGLGIAQDRAGFFEKMISPNRRRPKYLIEFSGETA